MCGTLFELIWGRKTVSTMTKAKKDEQKTENQDNITSQEAFAENTEQTCADTDTDNMSETSDDKEDKVSEMSAQIAEWKDKYLRLQAEFDNYRKRTLKEKMELIDSASKDVIKSLLVVLDDFDRAEEAFAKSDNIETLREGLDLIHTKLVKVLEDKGLSSIEADGEMFDTDYHEAITKIPAPSEELKGKVVDTVEKGYKLKDKVIRYSKVVVGE